MDKTFQPSKFEKDIYAFWEKNKLFVAKVDKKKKPFTIILPPPNANAALHWGHAMYVYEDVMIRYHKLMGFETLWFPGADHAGIETQFVFEKHLKKQGKSRFDFERPILFQMIWDFVQENRGTMEKQLKSLGFALDWTKEKYTMDPDIVDIVYDTFEKLFKDGLIYRAERLVNYCTSCGTSFSDLEVVHKEQTDPLYYMKYGPFTLATVRPETKFGDTAVAVNPKDKRYKKWIGKIVEVEGLIGKFKLKVVGDDVVDPKFGTGVVKVTPAHDFNDYEIAKRHNIPLKQVIGFDGRLNNLTGKYEGLTVKQAREKVVADLEKKGLMVKIKTDYSHRVATCYRCGRTLEPLPKDQWYIKVKPLVDEAKKLVVKNKVEIYPKRFKKQLTRILDEFIDWNISRQIVWGIRIPAWRCVRPEKVKIMGFHESVVSQVIKGKTKTYRLRDHGFKVGDRIALENSQKKELFGYAVITKIQKTSVGSIDLQDKSHYAVHSTYEDLIKAFKRHNPEKEINKQTKAFLYEYTFEEITKSRSGCGRWIVSKKKPQKCPNCSSGKLIQDEDTFDTWFSSAQWPFVTLQSTGKDHFDYFYPTTVMETGYDILRAWVSRMIMVGYFVTKKEPFQNVFLHGMVRDKHGQKMSKSKGNVLDPMDMVQKFGADAFRAALLFGVKEGNDISFSEERIVGMRNFANKVWNVGRFLHMNKNEEKKSKSKKIKATDDLNKELEQMKKQYQKHMDKYEFSKALNLVHEFLWHRLADVYVEKLKDELKNGNMEALSTLTNSYIENLKMLHPFMPFITEALYQTFYGQNKSILNRHA
ncbi:hypothetical protein A3G67_01660 [Candidatus Roizmanbacteria bacterium RIFCSPLOWO2_12_FULL_40_12]|uniref:valine--tRNA ligase n=1 Tax=Candidatus Roizmanbacteria bacterium RIFCSPLOWO2_01_FULL_40_42 TaxID=1802066 RepID=A0A1F7J5V2_9BACT|nr:MAG: hypothetical protein A2779_02175 [Candidatus Roizmanbacteria bacterium RIFCSPHIGHO2_01_FULL_40_98]OGK28815.1 MAG: hypothetical protein A3C31_04340 [Candidatus Roizmanbacteria bacterium RIFCSPHIGHO2_02_FULL_40_53]OGK30207.1 MAG: hypothetical protein A2W49_01295 [Candidatus Roizmanbacteria bacterium RIFCSPHIGHO2_12_41_18]OGK36867.1 MAG: hypothetical protein A3E69_01690 [Candidatus Roizmanbacteria bacterium RIFCSPHIGHO2_12_FULL_40_130]OGK50983.1 MAG: hypothetical protein A3B50_03540 [Candi